MSRSCYWFNTPAEDVEDFRSPPKHGRKFHTEYYRWLVDKVDEMIEDDERRHALYRERREAILAQRAARPKHRRRRGHKTKAELDAMYPQLRYYYRNRERILEA